MWIFSENMSGTYRITLRRGVAHAPLLQQLTTHLKLQSDFTLCL